MAWADGVMAEAEAEAMKRLIGSAELTDDERATALSWLDAKVELDTTNIQGLALEARKGVYRAACRLAAVDLDVATAERSFLHRLSEALELDEDVARELRESVPGHQK